MDELLGLHEDPPEDFYLPVAEYASVAQRHCGLHAGEVMALMSEYSREASTAPSEDRYASVEPEGR